MKPAIGDLLFVTGPALTTYASVATIVQPHKFEGDSHGVPASIAARYAEELGIETVYLVTYRADGAPCCTYLLQLITGEWRDLRGSPLTVTACARSQ